MDAEAKKRDRPRGEHRTSAANRQKILEATLQVAQEFGYQGTTIPRVSLKAQLPTGSVYWHFESKDMLFASLMEPESGMAGRIPSQAASAARRNHAPAP